MITKDRAIKHYSKEVRSIIGGHAEWSQQLRDDLYALMVGAYKRGFCDGTAHAMEAVGVVCETKAYAERLGGEDRL